MPTPPDEKALRVALQDYSAPIADDGFTDAWLVRAAAEPSLQGEGVHSDILSRLNSPKSDAASGLRRSLVALSMGAAAGAIWMRAAPLLRDQTPEFAIPALTRNLPDLSADLSALTNLPVLLGGLILFGIAVIIIDSVSSF